MTQLIAEILVFVAAIVGAMIGGRASMRQVARLKEHYPQALVNRHGSTYADIPLIAGLFIGGAGLVLAKSILLEGDRFIDPRGAVRILAAVLGGGILILFAQGLALTLSLASRLSRGAKPDAGALLATVARFRRSWLLGQPIVELIAATIVVSAGIRFHVLGLPGPREMELGSWTPVATVAWIFIATNVLKLLGGIPGAANGLLALAALATYGFGISATEPEPFLRAFSVLLAGGAVGSFLFNGYPVRLPLTLRGHAYVGFLFAVLMVIARQKTAAAGFLLLPLLMAIVLLAAGMTFLLRRMTLPAERKK